MPNAKPRKKKRRTDRQNSGKKENDDMWIEPSSFGPDAAQTG